MTDNIHMNEDRDIAKGIIEACKEVNDIRAGKKSGLSVEEGTALMEKWIREAEDEERTAI